AMVGLMIGIGMVTVFMLRRQRGEIRQVEAIEELVQLRRWPEAAILLQSLLSEPTRTPQTRVQALFYLSSVLARYHRFEDAIPVLRPGAAGPPQAARPPNRDGFCFGRQAQRPPRRPRRRPSRVRNRAAAPPAPRIPPPIPGGRRPRPEISPRPPPPEAA